MPIRMGVLLVLALAVAGCGQEIKRENEQLKGQLAILQPENLVLKTQVTTLRADVEALKRQVEELTRQKGELEAALKAAEAKAAVKPGTLPPLRPKKR